MDSIKQIRDLRHNETNEDVLGAIVGPPPQRDPNLIELKEAGMALTRWVIHPKEAGPLKEAKTYLVKHLSLIPE